MHSPTVVVGSGPNGLSAAITLAMAGKPATVFEANPTIGGGARSSELTLPGFVHDICSAVHPMGCASPFFLTLPLSEYGLHWINPDAPLAHPFDDGNAVMLERSIEATCRGLGGDAAAYYRLINPLVHRWSELVSMILQPVLRIPHSPFLLARFGVLAMMPARLLVSIIFRQQRARALFAGNAAHSMLSLDKPISSAFGLIFGVLGHAVGWPIARGGSQKVADSLASYLRSLGGKIYTEKRIENLDELSAAGSIFLDVTPKQVLNIAGSRLPPRFQKQLRKYRYGPGVFKIDYALDSPVPWTARECLRAGTVHIGGDFEEIAASEKSVSRGDVPERPFVIASQPSLFDSTRAPEGKHTLWAYCHVPNDSTFDMTRRIETQIERFAPGFKDRILARHVMTPGDLELHNANNIGGDIAGGILDIRQFITRPTRRLNPYSTPIKGLYLCSASTPPGWGVHGMCGYNAARSALLAGKAH